MQKQTRTNKRHSRFGLLASGLALIASACAAPAAIPATPMAKATVPPVIITTESATTPQPTATALAIGAPTTTVVNPGKGGDIKAARTALQPAFVDGTNAFGFTQFMLE